MRIRIETTGGSSMADLEKIRQGVLRSLPEIADIKDAGLQEKVADAWVLALSESEYEALEDMSSAGVPGSAEHKNHSQAHHLRGVAEIALGMADGMEKVVGPMGIDRDVVLAGGLCHDIGKVYEMSARNQARWRANAATTGWPAFRHSTYGAYLCLKAGLPDSIAHIAAYHSGGGEGEWIQRSLECIIVAYADLSYWLLAERGDLLTGPLFDPGRTIIKFGTITNK
jgi:putative nucleotidyltransferase with HDIG domain